MSETASLRKFRSTVFVAALATSTVFERSAFAQGLATASVRGTVRNESGTVVEGAHVDVRNLGTGFTLTTRVVNGRFAARGLEPGGLYVVAVRQIGFLPQQSRPVTLTLGEPLEISFVLSAAPTRLNDVLITERAVGGLVRERAGPRTTITDSALQQLPSLNRNFLDFVSLAPDVSTKIGFQRVGMSASGANFRFNSYLVNGVDERFVNSNVSPGQNGKSVPIDAVKEYQVLVSPYEVRYGDFAGGLVNTVTQSGTNDVHGSAYTYWRNNRLARGGTLVADSLSYDRTQYGLSLGGPIVRDHVHFFVAPEIQRLTSPAPGPYIGQARDALPPLLAREADVARFGSILENEYGLVGGSGGRTQVGNPLRNLFARLDAAIPRWNSRAIIFTTYAHSDNSDLSRSSRDFYLSSATYTGATEVRLTSLQLHTDVPTSRAIHNELVVSQSSDKTEQIPVARQPLVRVFAPGTDGELVSLYAGPLDLAQGLFRWGESRKVRDEASVSIAAGHTLVFGAEGERFRIQPGGVRGGYGTWTFSDLDALAQGVAERYDLRKDFGSASTVLRGGQYGFYVEDEWRPAERLSLTFGSRADILHVDGHAPYNASVDSIFGRRTDEMPRARVHLSPRVGFSWGASSTGSDRVHGGVGIFTGRPPLAWLSPALANYGVGIATLSCGALPTDRGLPPAFQPDYRAAPTACAAGATLTAVQTGDVDLLDRNLRMAEALRGSVGYDRRLPWQLQGSVELLATRYLSDFMFANLNLDGPQAIDRYGRVLYGTIAESGSSTPALRSSFAEVIDLTNTSKNRAYQLSTRLEKRFERGIDATVSYTYSGVRDVQSPSRVNTSGSAIWADARAVSGRHDDLTPGVSLNDLPHRVVAAVTYTAPWRRRSTGLSLYYVGESGTPFTYRATGVGRRGDLNADGSNTNDPIYVPRNTSDTNEIRFSGVDASGVDNSASAQADRVRAQQTAFQRFVDETPCLRHQRGRILERNSCREPWSHMTVAALHQAVPMSGRKFEVEVDAFNLANLLNPHWGQVRVADAELLEHVGQTKGSAESSQPIFRFDTARAKWTTLRTESAFQLQLAARYRF